MARRTAPELTSEPHITDFLYGTDACADPGALHDAPHVAPVRRLDEVKAAKDLVLYTQHNNELGSLRSSRAPEL